MIKYIQDNMTEDEIRQICDNHMAAKADYTIEHFQSTEFEAEKKVVEEFLTDPKNYDERAFQAYLDLLSELQIFENNDETFEKTAEVKKNHILTMFDRLEKFKQSCPSVPEDKVKDYLTQLEEFLSNPDYSKTLAMIKPHIADVYDILMSQSEDIEYLDKLNERMMMYLK
jgi:hypothetical protein